MKSILFTAWNEKYDPLATLTVPLMGTYATHHALDFDEITEPMMPGPDGIYWTKFVAALKYLREGYGRVIWLDVDQMITNQDIIFDLPKFGFHVSSDWGFDVKEPSHFSVCGFVAHRDSIYLFEEALALEPESRGKPFPEQEPMRQIVRARTKDLQMYELKPQEQTWNAGINIHQPRFLNAVPNEVCPGKVVDPWKPGDFAAHLTMLDVPKRIELFHEIKKQAGI